MEDDSWRWSVGIPGLMRAARGCYASAIQACLAEAGFDDLPRNGGFALALLIHVGDLSHLTGDLGVSRRVLGDLIDSMVMRGYLERGAPPAGGGLAPVVPTVRGRAAEQIMAEASARIDALLQERLGADGFEAFQDG
ncbi:MAG TPA: MarR family winged helix-turn-helix transcriptional regulator, partial [Streptosporangiaceae bacterium]|nr:MarR family winged helix-turn-helix transcriptional regulator [Streptosporangiaceae bacterium]